MSRSSSEVITHPNGRSHAQSGRVTIVQTRSSDSVAAASVRVSSSDSVTAASVQTRSSDKKEKDVVINGSKPEVRKLHISWVLHSATVFADYTRPHNAAIECVSVPMYMGRQFCKAKRFVQAAVQTKREQDSTKTISYYKTARSLLRKITSPFASVCRLQLDVVINLAAELAPTEPNTAFKLDKEACEILETIRQKFKPIVIVDDNIARAYNNFGSALEKISKPADALEKKFWSLQLFIKVHDGKSHVNVAALLSNVGLLLEAVGRKDEAIAYKQHGLEMLRLVSDSPDSERIATALNNLGVSYQELGQREKGIDFQRQALEMRRRLYSGNDHEKLASSLNNVGAALETTSDRVEGIKFLREGLVMNKRLHPTGHRNLAMNLTNLGSALLHVDNELPAAKAHLEQGIAMFIQVLGPNQQPGEELAISYSNLGIIEERMKNWPDGLEHKTKALEIRKRLYSNRDDEALATSLCCVGESLARLDDRKPEGVQMLRDSLAMFDRLRAETIEVILAVSAILPHIEPAAGQKLAMQNLPRMKHVLSYAPSYHQSQVLGTFAWVLRDYPATASDLKIQREAADMMAIAENNRIVENFQQPVPQTESSSVPTSNIEARRINGDSKVLNEIREKLIEKFKTDKNDLSCFSYDFVECDEPSEFTHCASSLVSTYSESKNLTPREEEEAVISNNPLPKDGSSNNTKSSSLSVRDQEIVEPYNAPQDLREQMFRPLDPDFAGEAAENGIYESSETSSCVVHYEERPPSVRDSEDGESTNAGEVEELDDDYDEVHTNAARENFAVTIDRPNNDAIDNAAALDDEERLNSIEMARHDIAAVNLGTLCRESRAIMTIGHLHMTVETFKYSVSNAIKSTNETRCFLESLLREPLRDTAYEVMPTLSKSVAMFSFDNE